MRGAVGVGILGVLCVIAGLFDPVGGPTPVAARVFFVVGGVFDVFISVQMVRHGVPWGAWVPWWGAAAATGGLGGCALNFIRSGLAAITLAKTLDSAAWAAVGVLMAWEAGALTLKRIREKANGEG